MYLADSIRHVSVCIEHLPFQGNENFKCSASKKMHLCFRVQANVIGSALIFIQVIAVSDTSNPQSSGDSYVPEFI